MTDSNIEWTDKTWNVLRGCSRVSAGCENCYAEAVAARFSGPGLAYEGLARRRSNGKPQWTGVVKFVESKLLEPFKWREPKRVFVNSMSDLFHEKVSDETLDRIFAVMAIARRHTFQILTKRPQRMLDYLSAPGRVDDIYTQWSSVSGSPEIIEAWPLPNVHVGTSIEDQPSADVRVPLLRETPAAVRFLSAEPLLAPIGLRWLLFPTPGIDWVIVGGESGRDARPMDVAWLRSIVEQCQLANVPVFVKQMGSRPISKIMFGLSCNARVLPDNEGYALKLRSKKGGNPSEWPEELRVRQFPAVAS